VERAVFQTKGVEKIETLISYWVTSFRKSCCLWANVEK